MRTVLITTIAGFAGLAAANPYLSQTQSGHQAGNIVNLLDYATVTTSTDRSNQSEVTITFTSDVTFNFGFPNANNFIIDFSGALGFSGEEAQITGLGWDTVHTAFAPSWLLDFKAEFTDVAITDGVGLRPSATGGPGGPEANSSGGVLDLIGLALDFTLADGQLLITLWDDFDDFGGAGEGVLLAGSSFTVQGKAVPTPGAFAVLGLGGLLAARRRR